MGALYRQGSFHVSTRDARLIALDAATGRPCSGFGQAGTVILNTDMGADYYAGYRTPALEKYATSVVALDAKTGRLVWAFQTLHHDIWDYDVPAAPVLFDYPMPQGRVPALLQPTKQGEMFVLDRRTGKPIVPVTERATPQGGVAKGEWLSPTQPFSAFPTLMGAPLTEADMWGLTPLDQLWCRVQFKKARYEGLFTPMGVTQAMVRWPGSSGIYNWGSVSIA